MWGRRLVWTRIPALGLSSLLGLFVSFTFGILLCSLMVLTQYLITCFELMDGVVNMGETIMLKISKKGDRGFQVCSVPVQKLKKLAFDKRRFWSLEGDFLVLRSYT